MKRIRSGREKFQFEIRREEKALLLQVLRLYPLVPSAHHRLSRGRQIPDQAENQELLEESLNARRRENRKQVEFLLNESDRFTECQAGYRASFTRGEIEWLLQVLNDVRLGSWLALGSPDPDQGIQKGLSPQTASHVMAMDVAGFFEMSFLRAVSGGPKTGHA